MKLFCTLALVATASALVETRLDSSMLDSLSGDAKFGAYKTMFGKSYGSAISAFTRDIDSFIAKDDFELGRALDGALQAAFSEHALHLCPPRASFGWPELEQCPLLRQIELCRCRWCRG